MNRKFQNPSLEEGGHPATKQSFSYSSLTLRTQKCNFILSTQSLHQELDNKILQEV